MTFSFMLNFYNKDLNRAKAKHVKFICQESKKDRFTHTMRRKTLLMANLFDNDDGNKPLEFSILYTIERQLPIVWQ